MFFLFIDLKIIFRYIYPHFIIGSVNDEYSSSRIHQPSPCNSMRD
jgi:hypothetical protein